MTANPGPAPRTLTDGELVDLLAGQRFGVPAALRRDGRPHLSTVLYHWDADERVVRVSTTADRLKARRIRADPRVALHVSGPDVWSFATAEGEAELVEDTDGDEPDRRLTITFASTARLWTSRSRRGRPCEQRHAVGARDGVGRAVKSFP
ncbi:pyridoxamine 5'-phosphate oxidase family protein [Actinosynnema sp. NPDC053489]|uniref:pyridoxamine 5'-phosphate oxidase family protein n=1 Tax=Actinosynnema sp. NPDC053489 TaxID=3363916 RepID=UPI0037CC7C41